MIDRKYLGSALVEIEGLFTHFAKADEEDKEYTEMQVKLFRKVLKKFKAKNINVPLIHCSNSAGTMDQLSIYPRSFFEDNKDSEILSRIGISLYGLKPSGDMENPEGIKLKEVLSWKSKIVHVKDLKPGQSISYGGTYTTSRKPRTVIATLPLGYADGFRRLLSGPDSLKDKWKVLVRGVECEVVGRVCMDMTMIDVSEISSQGKVSEGEEVVLLGRQGSAEISCDDFASRLKTINYEVTCLVGKRVPRVYISNNSWTAYQSFDNLVFRDDLPLALPSPHPFQ
jgi:alanine racemase